MDPVSGLARRFAPFATIWAEMEGPVAQVAAPVFRVAVQLPAGPVSAALTAGPVRRRASATGGRLRDTSRHGREAAPTSKQESRAPLSSLPRSRHSRKLAYLLGLRLRRGRGLGLVLGLGLVENLEDCTYALRLRDRVGARVLARKQRGRAAAMQVRSEPDAERAPADQHHRCRTYSPSSRPGRGATLASDTPQDSSPAAYPLRIGRDSGPQRTHTRQGFRPAW